MQSAFPGYSSFLWLLVIAKPLNSRKRSAHDSVIMRNTNNNLMK